MVKFFIDPGHGGTDPGAVGNGLQEKELTLQISKRIRDILGNYENTKVKLSREEDQTLSLKQRTDMANRWGADFLLSVHINSGGGTGYEDFVHPNSDEATVAYQNVIHEEIIKQIDFYDRGKKMANFHVLRESNMPSLLTENGFIDNASDTAKLKKSEYIDQIALGHINGLVKAFGLKRKENTNENSTQQEKKVEKLFEPNSPTLKQAVEYVLYRMELEGDLTAQWRQKLLAGTLTESEAIGLLFVAVERGFIHNKYSNK